MKHFIEILAKVYTEMALIHWVKNIISGCTFSINKDSYMQVATVQQQSQFMTSLCSISNLDLLQVSRLISRARLEASPNLFQC